MKAIASDAFRLAAMRSERYRTIGLLSLIGVSLVVSVVFALIHHNANDTRRIATYAGFWIFCGAAEIPMLILVNRRTRPALLPIPAWVLALYTAFECSLPTIALLGLTIDKSYLGPYLALASPAVLLYCFFIILSTLRLSPALSLLSGIVSAAGYLAAYLFTLHIAPNNANRQIMPPDLFIAFPLWLLFAGLIAAAVARQIRQHVIAALNEAETRRKLDLVNHDLNIARNIQMGLLPKNPPTIKGYDIAGFSRPADQTGGDYYDWLELPEGQILVSIADAAGHGIGPALLVTACRAYFRALANHLDPLERITAQVDNLIAADVPADRFITAAIALLNPQANTLSLYSAGQAPLYLYIAAEDRVTTFDADQPPLGLRFGNDGSFARIIPLAPGDALVLVTDGFFESANPKGELLGTDRFGEVIQQNHAQNAATLIRSLCQSVLAFSGTTPQSDDLTAVVIKRNA